MRAHLTKNFRGSCLELIFEIILIVVVEELGSYQISKVSEEITNFCEVVHTKSLAIPDHFDKIFYRISD